MFGYDNLVIFKYAFVPVDGVTLAMTVDSIDNPISSLALSEFIVLPEKSVFVP